MKLLHSPFNADRIRLYLNVVNQEMLDLGNPFPMEVWVPEIFTRAIKGAEADTLTSTLLATVRNNA
jgi:hypothetical protein